LFRGPSVLNRTFCIYRDEQEVHDDAGLSKNAGRSRKGTTVITNLTLCDHHTHALLRFPFAGLSENHDAVSVISNAVECDHS
jgi:hypothetical protein